MVTSKPCLCRQISMAMHTIGSPTTTSTRGTIASFTPPDSEKAGDLLSQRQLSSEDFLFQSKRVGGESETSVCTRKGLACLRCYDLPGDVFGRIQAYSSELG